MKKTLCALLALALLLSLAPSGFAAGAAKPVIALTYAPEYGESESFEGVVFTEDGEDFDPADYRISLYLQLAEGGAYWVKPTYALPYAQLDEDGGFSIRYATGGRDLEAQIIHIMLIPATLTPGTDFSATRAAALDYIRIDRSADGEVTVEPQRPLPGEERDIFDLSVSEDRLALNVGFYTDGGKPGDALDPERMRALLEAVSPFCDTVRFYGASGELYEAYELAASMGFNVIGGAWLSGDEEADLAEMDALIEHCNKGYVSLAVVGSETLQRGELSVNRLVADLEYVRSRLDEPELRVTTADTACWFLCSAKLQAACDLLFVNNYPFWDGVDAAGAADSFAETMERLREKYPDAELICSETGWPTGGGGVTEQEAAQYFEAIRAWSLESGTQVVYFSAADEPWKTADEGGVGAHWGFLDSELRLKACYGGLDFFKGVYTVK